MSRSKEIELIKKGQAIGYTDEECLLAVQQYRHNQKVAAQRRKMEKERKLFYEKLIKQKREEYSTVEREITLPGFSDNPNWDGTEVIIDGEKVIQDVKYFKKDGKWWSLHQNDNYTIDEDEFKKEFDTSVNDEWSGADYYKKGDNWYATIDGEEKKVTNSKFVSTLDNQYNREVKDISGKKPGEEGYNTTIYGDRRVKEITNTTYTDKLDEKYKISEIEGDGIFSTIYKSMSKEDRELFDHNRRIAKQSDYRPVLVDGEYEWHYILNGKDEGKIKNEELLGTLNESHPNALNEYKYDKFRIKDGKWHVIDERTGDLNVIEDNQLLFNLDTLHKDARDLAAKRKDGNENREYTLNIFDLERKEELDSIKKEVKLRGDTSYEDFVRDELGEYLEENFFGPDAPPIHSGKFPMKAKWTKVGLRKMWEKDPEQFLKIMDRVPRYGADGLEFVSPEEIYKDWQEQPKGDLPTNLSEKVTSPDAYVKHEGEDPLWIDTSNGGKMKVENGEYYIPPNVDFIPDEKQAVINQDSYNRLSEQNNIDMASTDPAMIEKYWGWKTAGDNSISEIVEIAKDRGFDNRDDFKEGEYLLNGQTYYITQQDVADWQDWKNHQDQWGTDALISRNQMLEEADEMDKIKLQGRIDYYNRQLENINIVAEGDEGYDVKTGEITLTPADKMLYEHQLRELEKIDPNNQKVLDIRKETNRQFDNYKDAEFVYSEAEIEYDEIINELGLDRDLEDLTEEEDREKFLDKIEELGGDRDHVSSLLDTMSESSDTMNRNSDWQQIYRNAEDYNDYKNWKRENMNTVDILFGSQYGPLMSDEQLESLGIDRDDFNKFLEGITPAEDSTFLDVMGLDELREIWDVDKQGPYNWKAELDTYYDLVWNSDRSTWEYKGMGGIQPMNEAMRNLVMLKEADTPWDEPTNPMKINDNKVEDFKMRAIQSYLDKDADEIGKLFEFYEKEGIFEIGDRLDRIGRTIAFNDADFQIKLSEFEDYKSKIDSGEIEDTEENLKKLDAMSVGLNVLGGNINTDVNKFNEIINNKRNATLMKGFDDVLQKNTDVKEKFLAFKDGDSLASQMFKYNVDQQLKRERRAGKTTRIDIPGTKIKMPNAVSSSWAKRKVWQGCDLVEGLWSGFAEGFAGLVGTVAAYTAKQPFQVDERGNPILDADGNKVPVKDMERFRARIVEQFSEVGRNARINLVDFGPVMDPTKSGWDAFNWAAAPGSVGETVGMMWAMFGGGGIARGVIKGAGGVATRAAARYLPTTVKLGGVVGRGLSKIYKPFAKTLGFTTKKGVRGFVNRKLGDFISKKSIINRSSQAIGGMGVYFPQNLRDAILQTDEKFTMEDAMAAAWEKTYWESAIEILNPDLDMFGRFGKFGSKAAWKNLKLWKDKKSLAKFAHLFLRALKEIPMEMIEENLQEWKGGQISAKYNKEFGTDFHIPKADDYLALNVLTPLTVLTAGFIRTKGFTRGARDASMYQGAIENYTLFEKEMQNAVDDPNIDFDQEEMNKILDDIQFYRVAQNGINADEWLSMTDAERQDTLKLLVKKDALKKDIEKKEGEIEETEDKLKKDDNKKDRDKLERLEGELAGLEKDSNNTDEGIKKNAASIKKNFKSREEQSLDARIALEKLIWKSAEIGSKERADSLKKIRDLRKQRNEVREKGSLYEFNGKGYNTEAEFFAALVKARDNGYFKGRNRPKIRISNRVNTEKAERVARNVANITGGNIYQSSEVLMSEANALEAEQKLKASENKHKKLSDFQEELDQEKLKKKPDDNKIQELRNVIRLLQLKERGYRYSPNARGLVMTGEDASAADRRARDTQRRLDANVKAVEEIANNSNIRTALLTKEKIIEYQKNGVIEDPEAHLSNAFMMPQMNEETGKYVQTLVINEDVARDTGATTAASHELLHAILFSVLNGPLRIVVGKDGQKYQTHLTPEGTKLIRGFLALLKPSEKAYLDNMLQKRRYISRDANGDIIQPFEVYAEEYLNHYHDAVVRDKVFDLNAPDTRGTMKKIQDYFMSWFKENTDEKLHNVIDMNLNSPTKLLEFMRTFNKQALENKFSEQVLEQARASNTYYGEVVVDEPGEKTVPSLPIFKSRAERADAVESEVDDLITKEKREQLVKEVNDIYNDPNLSMSDKQGLIAMKYRGMAETRFDIALNEASVDLRKILLENKEDIIAQMTYDPGDPKLKSRNVMGMVLDFEAEKHKYRNPAAYINQFFKWRSYEVFSLYAPEVYKKRMEDARAEVMAMEAEEDVAETEEGIQAGRIVVLDRITEIDDNPVLKNKVEAKKVSTVQRVISDPSIVEGQNYKSLKDMDVRSTVEVMMYDPTAVYVDDGSPVWQRPEMQALIGTSIAESIVNKLTNDANLNQQDIKQLQPFFNKHAQTMISAMPQGFMTDKNNIPTTATGVPKVLLNPFYNKGRRVKNLWPQRKKSIIGVKEYLAVHGITPAGEINIVGKESNVSQRIKASISVFGQITTNQIVREHLMETGASEETVSNLANGKSKLVFSNTEGDIDTDGNVVEGLSVMEAQMITEMVRAYDIDPKRFRELKNLLEPTLVSIVEDIFLNPNLGPGKGYNATLLRSEFLPDKFKDDNFEGQRYKGPRFYELNENGVFVATEYQYTFAEQSAQVGEMMHPNLPSSTLISLLGFKDPGKLNKEKKPKHTMSPKLHGDLIARIENRKFTDEQLADEEAWAIENKIKLELLKDVVPMMNKGEINRMLTDIAGSHHGNLASKLAKLTEYRNKIIKINKANHEMLRYVALKLKEAYNETGQIDNNYMFLLGSIQTNIIEGTRALSTFEYIYLTEGKQVPTYTTPRGLTRELPKPSKTDIEKRETREAGGLGMDEKEIVLAVRATLTQAEYYNHPEYRAYVEAWSEMEEWGERMKANRNLEGIEDKAKRNGTTVEQEAEVLTIEDLSWKNEHIGANASTEAERTDFVLSNGQAIDVKNYGNDHRSFFGPTYLMDQFLDAKIMWEGKEVSNKVSYEGPFRMTKFSGGKSKNIFHYTGENIVPYLLKVEEVGKLRDELGILSEEDINAVNIIKKARFRSSTVNPSKGMSVWDLDDTLAKTKSKVLFTAPDGTTGDLNAEEYASQYVDLLNKGYEFDFSQFDILIEPTAGPFFKKFQERIKKFGIENNFILTARPAESAIAIQAWLKSQGLDMPIENITGLANSTSEAKALWMAEKVGEGYNDIYFADDSLANVQAVNNILEQFDVKRKVQQAKIKFSRSISPTFNGIMKSNAENITEAELEFNRILEQTTGVGADKRFSDAQAKIRGAKKGWKFWVPPSAEDFKGLIYKFIGKGKQGEAQMAFFKKALFDPYNRGYNGINETRQVLNDQYRTLLKKFPSIKRKLNDKIPGTNYTVAHAIRVYLWNKSDVEIPGISARDLVLLTQFVEANPSYKMFAETLGIISQHETGYVPPTEYWAVENIQSDINRLIGEIDRGKHLNEWKQNVVKIFGDWENGRLVGENMNKIEAIYGTDFREALEDMLWAMEFGSSRTQGKNKIVNAFNNWANQSVGAIMFFNMRSALLQTISSVNYINWSDNNPFKAGLALANFPQFIKDFAMIFNSSMLKQRRAGQQRGVNESELAEAAAGARNGPKAILNFLLKKGFLPTQIADSFAIASGGATFYRNRVNTYLKQGMDQKAAEAKAWEDFQENTEESQQSARPDMISQQQRSPLGRYILAFKNTPMQYARLMKKAFLDLKNNRGDAKTNISKIIYYGMVQNFIFSAMQQALWAVAGGEADEEEKEERWWRVGNSMIDSIFGGLGIAGNIVMTIKNTILEYLKQEGKGWGADHTYTILKFLGLSPTIGSKVRKLYSAIQERKFNKDIMGEMSLWDIDNPTWAILANIISATTNIPLDRLVRKMGNIEAAITEHLTFWQRLALLLGWNTWDLGIQEQDVLELREEVKERKDEEKKKKEKKKEEIKKKEIEEEKEDEFEQDQEEERDRGDKDITCIAVNKSGERCGIKVEGENKYCTIHQKVEQRDDGTKVQCKKIKSNKERCKMKTSNKSGLCYYHD